MVFEDIEVLVSGSRSSDVDSEVWGTLPAPRRRSVTLADVLPEPWQSTGDSEGGNRKRNTVRGVPLLLLWQLWGFGSGVMSFS